MKVARFILPTMAAVLMAGTFANAAPHLGSSSGSEPSVSPSASDSPEPSQSPEPSSSPEPSETPSPEPTDSPSPDGGGTGGAPDFSACVGRTGLENAICRHDALLVLHPDNAGLQNSLSHLEANLKKHESRGQAHGKSDQAHGKSGEPHGHSGGSHGKSGH
jgi:hypothetical protein